MQTNFESKVAEVYERALRRGELYFIESLVFNVIENGVEFEIRSAPSLAKRPKAIATATATEAEQKDPFAPYSEDLFVQEYGKHVILLNKFCVFPNHILVVTKEFERQTDPLNQDDMAAIWYCKMQFKSQQTVAFYNCGTLSGASQPHKHVQIIPLPSDTRFAPPINAVIYKYQDKKPGELFNFQELPYVHYVVLLDPKQLTGNREAVSQYLAETYHLLINAMVERFRTSPLTASFPTLSYNFLMTHTWMMMVPRLSEKYEYISVNSLGFAGMILVMSEEDLEFVKNVGVLHILESIGISKDKNQLINGIHTSYD